MPGQLGWRWKGWMAGCRHGMRDVLSPPQRRRPARDLSAASESLRPVLPSRPPVPGDGAKEYGHVTDEEDLPAITGTAYRVNRLFRREGSRLICVVGAGHTRSILAPRPSIGQTVIPNPPGSASPSSGALPSPYPVVCPRWIILSRWVGSPGSRYSLGSLNYTSWPGHGQSSEGVHI